MKVVIVTNPYDKLVSEPKRQGIVADLRAKGYTGEIHEVDFMQVRNVLPVTTCPCVFIMFDEVCGDFEVSNVKEIIDAVAALGLPQGAM